MAPSGRPYSAASACCRTPPAAYRARIVATIARVRRDCGTGAVGSRATGAGVPGTATR